MNSSDFGFNLKRILQLARISIYDDWRPFLLAGLAIGGLVFISGLIFGEPPVGGFLFFVTMLTGLVLVSKLFSGLHKRDKGIYLFMLPASIKEKFTVQLLASLIGFYLYTLLITLFSATLSKLLLGVMRQSVSFTLVYPSGLWVKFQIYFFFHAIFFSGALLFKRNNFLKTLLVLMVPALILIMLSFFYLKNLLRFIGQSELFLQFNGLDEFYRFLGGPSQTTIYFFNIVIFVVVPLLLYGISFYKYKTYQVKA